MKRQVQRRIERANSKDGWVMAGRVYARGDECMAFPMLLYMYETRKRMRICMKNSECRDYKRDKA